MKLTDNKQSIFFKDIELMCKIGVYEHERKNPQRVIINLKLELSKDILSLIVYNNLMNTIKL